MTSLLRHITVDTAPPHEPYDLCEFWGKVLGFPVHPDDAPGDDEVLLDVPEGRPALLFVRVPEAKTSKNRVHFDLEPSLPRDEEVTRLLDLGATMVDDRRAGGRGWAVLADPAGNEFCVEVSTAERAVLIAEQSV
ncbi:VOC family protein [Actinophytocola gossypii]|uniref:VOC family protein n=1 Tax=Actinophytocola gossypii TaxID=2812003 RepID=A0ABT2JC85_9PSEU|nr:VOC family protein [Actinophytocola gossypii]MCT2585462.1 VOC family protein [Actinophytocola gossypii]